MRIFNPPETDLYVGSLEILANDVSFGTVFLARALPDVKIYPPSLDFSFVGIGSLQQNVAVLRIKTKLLL